MTLSKSSNTKAPIPSPAPLLPPVSYGLNQMGKENPWGHHVEIHHVFTMDVLVLPHFETPACVNVRGEKPACLLKMPSHKSIPHLFQDQSLNWWGWPAVRHSHKSSFEIRPYVSIKTNEGKLHLANTFHRFETCLFYACMLIHHSKFQKDSCIS